MVPNIAKDWDDMKKISWENDKEILEWMLVEERIKNWGKIWAMKKAQEREISILDEK